MKEIIFKYPQRSELGSLAPIAAASFLCSLGVCSGAKRYSGKRDRCSLDYKSFASKKYK